MLTDFLRLLLDVIAYLWPFKIVWQWERGSYYIIGKYWRDVGPGCWPKLPFFTDVKTEGVVSGTYGTPLQTITTKDGGTLTFSASMKMRVVDLGKSFNNVLNWDENAIEDASASLADKLADVDASKLEPEARNRLIGACKRALEAELGYYGLAVDRLRFNNFVRNMPVGRLFQDQRSGGGGDI